MCGIAGYTSIGRKNIGYDTSLVSRMQQVMAHRGPDGYSFYCNQELEIALTHRRLRIVDLSDAGDQPMQSSDTSCIVACNGEIYNHSKIKADLVLRGYKYNSRSDTETILHAYQEWGIDAFNHLNGMFAAVIIDKKSHNIFLIRDRFGIKPLYFSLTGGMLSFASEIKALWTLPWLSKEINQEAISHYLSFLATPAPLTLYQGIYKLPAGFYLQLCLKKRTITFKEWYNPAAASRNIPKINYDTLTTELLLEEALSNSVNAHAMADQPQGVFLSGGVDSSLLVALLQEKNKKLHTFTISFSDSPHDCEAKWARVVAEKFNTIHHEISITQEEAFFLFNEKVAPHQDEPLADPVCIPLYFVSQAARSAGVPVIHAGEGADELFYGYDAYVRYFKLYKNIWHWTQKITPSIIKRLAYKFCNQKLPLRLSAQDLLFNWSHNRLPLWSAACGMGTATKQFLYKAAIHDKPDTVLEQIYPEIGSTVDSHSFIEYHIKQLYKELPHADFSQLLLYLELKIRLPELILMRLDKMTMAASIESRVPFLEQQLVELALALPLEYKLHQGISKAILKKIALQHLPHSIVYRTKKGFKSPVENWFGTPNSPFSNAFKSLLKNTDHPFKSSAIEEIMKIHQSGSINYAPQLWMIHNLLANISST